MSPASDEEKSTTTPVKRSFRMAPSSSNSRAVLLICAGLAAITGLSFLPVLHNDFIMFDDGLYVVDNPRVLQGLKWPNFIWAFCTFRASNWHPLTWLSHMLDCQFYGSSSVGHHLSSLLLHIANTVLLFVVLARLTGARWPSAVVAAFFGVHPVHVESVAWVAERKDVLSAFFGLLVLFAYSEYVSSLRLDRSRRHIPSRIPSSTVLYILTFFFFGLGLMSKPMVVTLPFVLLLVDIWPLARLEPRDLSPKTSIALLILEKTPFFALAAVCCVVTVAAQSSTGAVVTLQRLTMMERIQNALVSFLRYIGKMVWPTHLAVFYPYRPTTWWVVLVAGLFIAIVCVAALYFRRGRGWLFTGWFWFLGMLVPVLGLVQVGSQAMADRYLYLPSIGFLIVVAWGLNEARRIWPQFSSAIHYAVGLMLIAFAALTFAQTGKWKNTETLFAHTLQVTHDNYLACTLLGRAMCERQRFDEAAELSAEALRISPEYAPARIVRGDLLSGQNQPALAVAEYEAALLIDPNNPDTHNNLANSLEALARGDQALEHYRTALRLNPDFALAEYNFALALARRDRLDEANLHYGAAIQLNPQNISAHYNLAEVLVHLGRLEDARSEYRIALRLNPKHFGAQMNLASVLVALGDKPNAIPHFRAALNLRPDFAEGHLAMARALMDQGEAREAFSHLYESVRLQPDSVPMLAEVSWILATNPRPELRNGSESVRLAENACKHADPAELEPLKSLAAAYAEVGRFQDARSVAEKALSAALASHQEELALSLEKQLQLYRSDKPFRDSLK